MCAQVGHAQYQQLVFKKEVDRLNARLLDLNHEGAKRKALDEQLAAKAKAQVELTPEAKNE